MSKDFMSAGAVSDLRANEQACEPLITEQKLSPFLFEKGMGYRIVRTRDCSLMQLRKLMRDGTFTKLYADILEVLYELTYLNAYLMRVRIADYYESLELMDAVKFKKVLRSMVRYGLIVQYEFYCVDEKGVEHGRPSIYSLSGGGYQYLKGQKGWKFRRTVSPQPFEMKKVLSVLAENQFYVMFEKQYRNTQVIFESDFCGNAYEQCGVRGLYGLHVPSGGELALFTFAVRQYDSWQEEYVFRLERIRSYAEKSGFGLYNTMVIVESEKQSMECERCRSTISALADIEIFYATDTSFITEEGVFDRLIEVTRRDYDMERKIFRLELLPAEK